MPRVLLSCLVLLLACLSPAAAQENALAPGARALSFALPYGGGTAFGYWRMPAEARRAGLFVSLDTEYRQSEYDSDIDSADQAGFGFAVGIGPVVRSYLSTEGRMAPFWQADLELGYRYRWT